MYQSLKGYGYGYNYITAYEIVGEVAAITGVEVKLRYGPPNSGYSIGKHADGFFYLTIPTGLTYINAQVRGAILHEALHILYSDILHDGSLTDVLKKLGYKEEELRVAHSFLNAFEDMRIQLKGEQELAGARYIFKDAYQFTEEHLVERMYTIMNNGKDPKNHNATVPKENQELARAHMFLGLSIGMVCGYRTYSEQTDQRFFPGNYTRAIITGFNGKNCLLNDPWKNTISKSIRDEMRADPLVNKSKMVAGDVSAPAINEAMAYFGKKLTATPTTLDGYNYAAKHFLPTYLSLLPTNLKEMFEKKKEMQKLIEDMLKAMEELAKTMAGKGGSAGGTGTGNALIRALLGEGKEAEETQKELSGNGWKSNFNSQRDNSETITRINEIGDSIKNKLAPILQEIKEWQETGSERTRLKRGKIDGRQLHRVAIDENDIFRRDIDPEYTDDVAFSVVVDTSGSMFGGEPTPVEVGFGIGAGLNKALLTIDKACTLISFSDRALLAVDNGQPCNEQAITKGMANSGGGTNLAEGTKMALSCLEAREEKTKIMFVISDGDVDHQDTTSTIKKCNEMKVIPYFVYINHSISADGECENGQYYQEHARRSKSGGKPTKTAAFSPSNHELFIVKLTDFVKSLLEGKGP